MVVEESVNGEGPIVILIRVTIVLLDILRLHIPELLFRGVSSGAIPLDLEEARPNLLHLLDHHLQVALRLDRVNAGVELLHIADARG